MLFGVTLDYNIPLDYKNPSCKSLEKSLVRIEQNTMGRNFASQIPREIVAVILEYEGGLVRAFQLDYIGGVYINVYRNVLGWASNHGTGIEKYLLMANQIYSNKFKK